MVDNLAVNYLNAFLSRYPIRKFKKSEMIIFQGEAPRNAYVIKSGIIKAYNISSSGDEKPIGYYDQGNAFPISWIYQKVPSAIYYYEAFTDSVEVYTLDRAKYANFIKKSPELLYAELSRLLSDQLGTSMRLNALQHSKASDKLIYTLHYLALTHGDLVNGKYKITLNLTHQDFANLTGLTRETAATELNKLKKLGYIDYGKNMPYILNLNKLLQLVNDQFIAEIKPSTLRP